MTIQVSTLLAILIMASVTYLTRIGGYLLLGDRELSARARIVLDAAPGCVLISVIAPTFASGRPADLMALGLTVLAATRLPLAPTVVIAISAAAVLRRIVM